MTRAEFAEATKDLKPGDKVKIQRRNFTTYSYPKGKRTAYKHLFLPEAKIFEEIWFQYTANFTDGTSVYFQRVDSIKKIA